MKRKRILLPHKFQVIGWGMFSLAVMLLLIILLRYEWSTSHENTFLPLVDQYSRYVTSLLLVLAYGSAFFVAFSEEKQEDELVREIRFSSVTIVAAVLFALMVLFSLLAALSQGFRLNFFTERSYYVMHWISNILFAFFIYVIVFRVRLFIIKRRLKNEE
jgi:multisubunit Na+/H+ antiporter MnhB subunit